MQEALFEHHMYPVAVLQLALIVAVLSGISAIILESMLDQEINPRKLITGQLFLIPRHLLVMLPRICKLEIFCILITAEIAQ